MTKDVYDTLTYKEKMLYDEMHAFGGRLTDRMEEIKDLLRALIAAVKVDP